MIINIRILNQTNNYYCNIDMLISIIMVILGGPVSAKVTDYIFEKNKLQKYVQELKMHRVLGNRLLTIWGIMALLRINSSSP